MQMSHWNEDHRENFNTHRKELKLDVLAKLTLETTVSGQKIKVWDAVHYRCTLWSDTQRACLTVLMERVSSSEQVEDIDRVHENRLFSLGQLFLPPLHFLVFKGFVHFSSIAKLIVCCWPKEETACAPSQETQMTLSPLYQELKNKAGVYSSIYFIIER